MAWLVTLARMAICKSRPSNFDPEEAWDYPEGLADGRDGGGGGEPVGPAGALEDLEAVQGPPCPLQHHAHLHKALCSPSSQPLDSVRDLSVIYAG